MKVIQIVPSLAAESSGPSYSVPALCHGLKANGCDVSLHFLGDTPAREFTYSVTAYPISSFPHPRLGRSPEMLRGLKSACKGADIIHNNSLWMMPNVYSALAKRGTRCRLVIQPRGTLSEYALSISRWKKRLIGWWGQYSAMKNADMWVATAASEFDDIRRLGYRQPICVLPNGVDLPETGHFSQSCSGDGKTGKAFTRRRMLFISRIHPKKNVDILLRAWAHLESKFIDWGLSIVGPDQGNPYADEMKALAKRLGCRHVMFEGELRGEEKNRFLMSSDCTILPTHSENFGMVVAESLACGTPVICSYGAPWEGLIVNKCGWWVPTEEAAIENAMAEAMARPRERLDEMGKSGQDWMRRDFSWNGIGAKMKAAYEWLLGEGDRPEWVRV